MRLLYGHSVDVASFVAERFPPEYSSRGFGPCSAIGVIDNAGHLVAGVVYSVWSPERRTIEITAASLTSRWLAPRFVAAFLEYPFEQLGCEVVTAHTEPDSENVAALGTAAGARSVTVPHLGGLDRPLRIMTLSKRDWLASRLARRIYGQQSQNAHAA